MTGSRFHKAWTNFPTYRLAIQLRRAQMSRQATGCVERESHTRRIANPSRAESEILPSQESVFNIHITSCLHRYHDSAASSGGLVRNQMDSAVAQARLVCSMVCSKLAAFYFLLKGVSADADPHYQKLYGRVTDVCSNRRGQPSPSAMKEPRPGRNPSLIRFASPSGKYAFLVIKMKPPLPNF